MRRLLTATAALALVAGLAAAAPKEHVCARKCIVAAQKAERADLRRAQREEEAELLRRQRVLWFEGRTSEHVPGVSREEGESRTDWHRRIALQFAAERRELRATQREERERLADRHEGERRAAH